MSYYDLLMGEDQKAAPVPKPAQKSSGPPGGGSYMDLLFGPNAQEMRAAPPGVKFRDRPVADEVAGGASPLQAATASLAPDVKGQIKLYAKQMGIPEDRFGVLDGNIVYWDQDAQTIRRVVPSVFKGGLVETIGRIAPWLGSQFGPSIPQAAGAITGTVMGPTGASIPAAAAAAGAADVGRQAAANYLIGDDERGIDWANAGGQAAMAGAGQGAAYGINRAISRNPLGVSTADRVAARDPARIAQSQALEAEARARGVDLSAGQTTGLRSIMQIERQLAKAPETADDMAAFVARQRGDQVPTAVRAEISQISPARGEAAVRQFREGAEAVATKAFAERSAEASRAYAKAYAAAPFGDDALKPILQRPSVQAAWVDAVALAKERGVSLPAKLPDGPLDWQTWDWLKQGLDAQVEKGTNALGRLTKFGYGVQQTKDELLRALDAANPAYAAARAAYGTASDAVDAIVNGGIRLARDMDGPTRQSMVNRVFSATNLTPEEVTRMRAAFASAGKLDDWNAGLASYLSSKLDAAMKELATGGVVGNVPGKFRTMVWGDPAQRRIVEAALGGQGAARLEGFERLMEVMQAASRVLPEGSPTATDLGALSGRKMVGKGARLLGKAASPETYLNIGNELIDAVAKMREPAERVRLFRALTSGNYDRQLGQLRMLPPYKERAMALTAQILAQAGLTATGAREPSDFEPPAYRQGLGAP